MPFFLIYTKLTSLYLSQRTQKSRKWTVNLWNNWIFELCYLQKHLKQLDLITIDARIIQHKNFHRVPKFNNYYYYNVDHHSYSCALILFMKQSQKPKNNHSLYYKMKQNADVNILSITFYVWVFVLMRSDAILNIFLFFSFVMVVALNFEKPLQTVREILFIFNVFMISQVTWG